MKKFTYLFILGGKIVWSGDDEKSLLERPIQKDLDEVKKFIKNCIVGDCLALSTGEMIFCTSIGKFTDLSDAERKFINS